MSIFVFHGSTDVINRPKSNVGRPNLDFGLGFYITDSHQQAVEWARRVADLMSREKALERLSQHRPNNQICLLSQQLIDKYLVYHGTETV